MPWVTYEVSTLEEALDIFKACEPVPWVMALAGGCTVLGPDEVMDARYNKPGKSYAVRFVVEDGAPYFECRRGVGFGSSEMIFYTRVSGTVLKVVVRIDTCPIQVFLTCVDTASRTPSVRYRKDYPAVPGATTLKWASGDESMSATYWYGSLDAFWASMGTYVDIAGLPC
jgi:hypothetical protein